MQYEAGFLNLRYLFLKYFSYDAFSKYPYDLVPSQLPKDMINNVANLEQEIESVSGDMNGQGGFILKNSDYFEGMYLYFLKAGE